MLEYGVNQTGKASARPCNGPGRYVGKDRLRIRRIWGSEAVYHGFIFLPYDSHHVLYPEGGDGVVVHLGQVDGYLIVKVLNYVLNQLHLFPAREGPYFDRNKFIKIRSIAGWEEMKLVKH